MSGRLQGPESSALAGSGTPLTTRGTDALTPVFLLRPPYLGMELRIGLESVTREMIGPGSVLLLRPAPPLESWSEYGELVRALRARLPQAPVVLLVDGRATHILGEPPEALRRTGCVCVHSGGPVGSRLREHLTRHEALGPAVVDWLRMRPLEMSPLVRFAIREVFDRAPGNCQMYDVCAQLGTSLSSTVESFEAGRLPHPGLWLEMARVLHAILRIQAHRGSPVEPLVRGLGFHAASTLGSQVYRTFRCRIAHAREALGWEWLLDRWISHRVPCPSRRRVA